MPKVENSVPCDLLCLPRLPGCSSEYFDADGLYLVSDTHILWLYIGRAVPISDLNTWFNLNIQHLQMKPKTVHFSSENEASARIQSAIDLIRYHSEYKQGMCIYVLFFMFISVC